MSESTAALVIASITAVLQAITVWQGRRPKGEKRGRHRRQ